MLSILTYPSYSKQFKIYKFIKEGVKKYLKLAPNNYLGHPAVVRSLITGLDALNVTYNLNPNSYNQLFSHVHVLAGLEALKYSIQLKQKGLIKKLTAGPNIVISSADHNGLIASPEIDLYLVNSEWTKSAYILDNADLIGRINYFPSGVDPNFWDVHKKNHKGLKLAFYKKRPEYFLYEKCLNIVKQFQVETIEIIYGEYSLQEFKQILSNVDFVIYFVEQESQGIALAEIWATDTPTIVWSPGIWHYNMRNYACSSAPYLTDETGLFFRTAEEFKELMEQGKLTSENFTPRRWVLENMTDEICTERFVKLICEV